jgi:hypothetical protein
MRNLSMLTRGNLFFFVFLLSLISIATSTPPYAADDIMTLNCGTSGISKDRDLREWKGDIGSEFTPAEEPNHKSSNSEADSQDYIDVVPYKTARISYSQFTYVFPVSTPGPKFVRLYFYAASYSGFHNSTDFFTVKVGSFTLLQNFSASIYIHANSLKESTLSKEFCINVQADNKLDVKFIPSPGNSDKFYAFINGIEIVSMPDDLYYAAEGPAAPHYVGQDYQFPIDYKMALEEVVRINVGGNAISPGGDTGMFRGWSRHEDYTLGGGVIIRDSDLKPIYSKVRNYTAPDDVYKTAVSMGRNRTKNLLSNLTWQIPVDSGFNYLVRLHFCEIQPQITQVGYRPFRIYIDNKIADDRADVLLWSNRNATPVYRDYVVRIENKADLFVALHPREASFAINDAILNGMEVFKLSNPDDGNLAVAGPDPGSLPSPPAAQQPTSTASESKNKENNNHCHWKWCRFLDRAHSSVLYASLETKEDKPLRFLLSTIQVLVLARARARQSKVDKNKSLVIAGRTMSPLLTRRNQNSNPLLP